MDEFNENDLNVLPQVPVEEVQPTVENDPRLTAALDSQRKQRLYSDMLRGFQQALQGSAPNSGFKADFTMADTLAKRADEPIAAYKSQLAQETASKKNIRDEKESNLRQDEFQMRINKMNLDWTDMQANRDPNSDQSKVAQDRIIELKEKLSGKKLNQEEIDGIRRVGGETLFKSEPQLQKDLVELYKTQNAELDRKSNAASDDKRLLLETERNKKFDAMEERRVGKENRQEKEGDRRYRQQQINTARGMIKDDPRFKKSIEQSMAFDDLDQLLDEAEKGNQQAVGALGTKLARAMGEVGVMTDTDVVRYVAGQSWGRKLTDWFTKGATGELSPETMKGIKSNLKVLKEKLTGDVTKVVNNSASRMKAAYPEMEDDDIRGILGFSNKQTQPVSTVKMIGPDGKTRMIPRDQVEAATKAGGQVVE